MSDEACTTEAHLHTCGNVHISDGMSWAIVFEGGIAALVLDDQLIGPRLVELLNRHGLIDVPTTPFAGPVPWPAPAGPIVAAPAATVVD